MINLAMGPFSGITARTTCPILCSRGVAGPVLVMMISLSVQVIYNSNDDISRYSMGGLEFGSFKDRLGWKSLRPALYRIFLHQFIYPPSVELYGPERF